MKLVGVWVSIALGCGKGKPEQATEQPIARSEPTVATMPVDAGPIDAPVLAVEVTGRQLYEDYEASVEIADARYLGKPVRLHGIVKDRGATVLQIMAPHQDHINAWFADGAAKDMHRAKANDEVFVRCTGAAKLDVPQLRDCVLEPNR